MSEPSPMDSGGMPASGRGLAPFLLLALGIALLTGLGIRHTLDKEEEIAVIRMQVIADLKVQQVGQWMNELERLANHVQSHSLAEGAPHGHGGGGANSKEHWLLRLSGFLYERGFSAATLLDARGRRLWGTEGAPPELAPVLWAGVHEAFRLRHIRRTDPYLDRAGHVRLDFAVPLAAAGPTPLLVLHASPEDWLYPSLQTWPVPSESGDIVLFRRDGDDVLFINALRRDPGAALRLRLPLASERVLAAQVLRGEIGQGNTVHGVDYRGVPVIGVMRAVAGTDWFLLAKQDRAELAKAAADRIAWLTVAGLAMLLLLGSGMAFLRQRDRLRTSEAIRRAQSEAEEELRRAKTAAEAASVAKSRFLATMSHEIRTPMNGVLGMAQLLLIPDVSEQERREYARTILTSGETLLNLLNDILDFSKVEAGKLELASAVFDPRRIAEEAALLFAEPAQAKSLRMDAAWNGPEGQRYRGDPSRLRQMLSNLIGNAIKFTSDGFVHVEVAEVGRRDGKALLEFAVTDSGIGIPPEKQSLLFRPFSQVDSSATREYGGSGLGLSIVRDLARLMGGDSGMESAPGKGARFWFRVRADIVPAGEESRQASAVPPAARAQGR